MKLAIARRSGSGQLRVYSVTDKGGIKRLAVGDLETLPDKYKGYALIAKCKFEENQHHISAISNLSLCNLCTLCRFDAYHIFDTEDPSTF